MNELGNRNENHEILGKYGTGDILIVNSSTKAAMVKLGEKEVEAKPGEFLVAKPSLDENGMFRLPVALRIPGLFAS